MGMVDKWLSQEGLMLIECWARDGLNTTQIAAKMGITRKTLWEWRRYYDEIEEAMSRGKEIVDFEVENALLKLALGGEKKTTRTIVGNPDSSGNRQVRVETTVENVLPNVTAALAWLNNRKPKDWKRNRDLFEIANEDDSNVTINVVRAGSALKTSCDVQKSEDDEAWDIDSDYEEKPKRPKQKIEEKKERRFAREARVRAQKEEYEKAMAKIKKEKEKTGKSNRSKKAGSNAGDNKSAELDENGWPIDWTPDQEDW